MEIFRAVVCLIGAIVGAGFASGREIVAFFASYGAAAPLLCLLAAAVISGLMCALLDAKLTDGLFAGGLGEASLTALLIASGGAMLAAAGDVCALTLPLRYAREIGLAATLLAALLLSGRSLRALSLPAALLLPALLATLTLTQSGAPARLCWPSAGAFAVGGVKALSYAGMNVALSAGVLCDMSGALSRRGARRACAWLFGALLLLLLLGVRALQGAGSEIMDSALPFVALLRDYGKTGFYLAAALLYFASFSTLAALLRALMRTRAARLTRYGRALIYLCVLLAAFLGLETLVESLYPILGAVCFLCIAAGLWRNRARKIAGG